MTMASVADQHLSSMAAVRLVASREITTRIRSRTFLITTALFIVAIIAGGFLLKLADGSSTTLTVGLTPTTASLAPAVETVAKVTGTDVETTQVADQSAGEAQVRDGDLDALLTGTTDDFGVTVTQSLDPALATITSELARQAALAREIAGLGGDPSTVAQQIASATPQITALEPQEERDGGQIVAGFVAGILIFVSIMMGGQLVAQGVVEEKASRVVELLLAALRPWQLMTGKVLGIGVIGLLQVALVVGAGAGTALSLGLLDASSLNIGAAAGWALVWFIVGYTMFSLVLAALAALVSRQEEVSSVIFPVMAVMMLPYIVGVSIAPWDPNNPLVVIMSRIPFCSPMIMPIRSALGTVGAVETIAVLALNVAIIPVLIWLSGRIYSHAVLRTGSRVKLRDALHLR